MNTYYEKYKQLYDAMIIQRNPIYECNFIMKNKDRYQYIERQTKIPWYVIGSIHLLESSGNFVTHLHNGDLLKNGRTIHVPKGRPIERPLNGSIYTWEESAVDAIGMKYNPDLNYTDIYDCLYFLESYNGLGYRKHGINTPYLWAGSNQYIMGKYVSDGYFDINAISKQIGCAVIIKRLTENGLI